MCSSDLPRPPSTRAALAAAVTAARAAGALMRANHFSPKRVNEATQHDIKLELDVRCQKLIERTLRRAFPAIPILGEEGILGDPEAAVRWVVDPIDGTVNFSYGIPHACVSIALQARTRAGFRSLVGVVYDPFTDELWTAIRGGPARLNGTVVRPSQRRRLSDAVVSIGFSKSRSAMEKTLPYFNWLARRVRKIRMLGAAALGLTYVASGRLDAYIERGINLWDVAAGGLIIECAGGKFWVEPLPGQLHRFRMVASNGPIHRQLPPPK